MIAALVHRELLSNLHTFRLAVALVFAVTLSALSTFIGSLDYSRNIDACEAEHRSINEHSASVSTYSELLPRIVIPPDPLSILSRGVLRTNGRTLYILLDYKIIAPWPIGAGFDNELMKALTQVDFTAVVAILLSFLAVVLGFDGICGELERGTLRQVLANPVPRTSLVLSKLIGGSLSLWVSLAVAYAVSLLIKVSNPDVHLTGDHWIRLGAYFLLACLFLSKVFFFGPACLFLYPKFGYFPDAVPVCLARFRCGIRQPAAVHGPLSGGGDIVPELRHKTRRDAGQP
jgi:hypothetical protein